METIFNSLTLLIVLSAAATAVAAMMAAQRRHAASAPAVVVSMIAVTWWSVSYALLLQEAPPSPRFWLTSTFVGVVLTPPAFLVFVLLFTERRSWLNARTLGVLAVQPLLVLPVLFTDAQHGLFFGPITFEPGEPFRGGPVFWLNALYSFILELLAFILLIQAFFRAPALLRRQIGFLVAGSMVPAVFNVLSLLLLTGSTGLDATPVGFAFTGMAMVYNLKNHGLFDLVPIARHEVVNRMSDGVLVLDTEARLIDVNPAASRLLSLPQRGVAGRRLTEVLNNTGLAERLAALEPGRPHEITLPGTKGTTLDVRLAELRTQKTRTPARLVVLRDITDLKRAELALKRQLAENEALQQQLRQEAIRDPLTGLYNRRFLEETLTREVARAERGDHSLSLAMLDIDHFKRLNDRFGHQEGDRVLRALGELLQNHARTGDAACRFGGEEFVLVFPDASVEDASERVNALREAFQALVFQCDGEDIQVTFSAGVAGFPDDGRASATLLRAADAALYDAKRAGRNRVQSAAAKAHP